MRQRSENHWAGLQNHPHMDGQYTGGGWVGGGGGGGGEASNHLEIFV